MRIHISSFSLKLLFSSGLSNSDLCKRIIFVTYQSNYTKLIVVLPANMLFISEYCVMIFFS